MDEKQAKWDQETVYALGLYKRLTRVLGIWPLDNRGIFSTLRISIVVLIQITLVTIFAQNWINKGNCGSITEIVDAISLMTTSSMAVIKVLLPWIHQKRISFIVNSAVEDWTNVSDKKSRDIMLHYAYMGRVVFIVQMFGAYMTIIPLILSRLPNTVIVNELFNRSTALRNIPIGPRCWVSLETSMFIYLLYYCFVCLHLFILATAYLGGDVFSFGLAMHVCGQFELLYGSLKALGNTTSERMQRKQISKFSKRHTHLLMFMDNFEESFNMLIFLELGANTFLICISEIILIWALKIGDSQIITAMIIRIYLMYIQIFMYSFIGEQLSSSAEKLQVSVYNCPWYNMKPNIAKDLKFIMMRNNYLFHLTAGKICDMNFVNFTSIVKSMFSYFSILRLMFDA